MEESANMYQGEPEEEYGLKPIHFSSDEEMLNYYLILGKLVDYKQAMAERSELQKLCILLKKIKSFLSFTQMMSTHQWGEGVSDIQKACGMYMLESKQNRKELLRFNVRIADHLEFITRISGKNYLVKQIEGLLRCHERHLIYLIRMKREDAVE